MTPSPIQALGVTQEWAGTSWKATGSVEGIGWLAAWGKNLMAAMEALQALAMQRGAEQAEVDGFDATRANRSTIQRHAMVTGGETRAQRAPQMLHQAGGRAPR